MNELKFRFQILLINKSQLLAICFLKGQGIGKYTEKHPAEHKRKIELVLSAIIIFIFDVKKIL